MKKVSVLWNGLSDAEKKPYNDKAEIDKQRKEDQTAEMVKNGYFMVDGPKSGVSKKKEKKVKRASKASDPVATKKGENSPVSLVKS